MPAQQPGQSPPTETIVRQGSANHFVGVEGVGGKLYLTTTRLYHQPHAANVQTQQASYPLSEIATAEKRNTFGIIPNGLLVTLKGGRQEKFVVAGRKKWITAITQQLHKPV